MRRTYVPRGHTPTLAHRLNWKRTSMAAALGYHAAEVGRGARWCFHLRPGSYDTDALIAVLEQLKAFYEGERAVLVWDGLSAHWSRATRAWGTDRTGSPWSGCPPNRSTTYTAPDGRCMDGTDVITHVDGAGVRTRRCQGGCGALVGEHGARARRVTGRQSAPRGGPHLYWTLHWGAHTEDLRAPTTVRASFEVLTNPV
nr:hypothetical protein [Nocardiopsis sp. TSRI0078]